MGRLSYGDEYRRDPVGLKSQDVDALSNLQQHTWSSLNYTLRAPPRYWIATAMDIIEVAQMAHTTPGRQLVPAARVAKVKMLAGSAQHTAHAQSF